MKAIQRRLSQLEAEFASRIMPPDDGSALEELMRRLESIRSCMLPEDLLPEHGPEAEAIAERVR